MKKIFIIFLMFGSLTNLMLKAQESKRGSKRKSERQINKEIKTKDDYKTAREFVKKGDHVTAVLYYKRLLKDYPLNPMLSFIIAKGYFDQKKYELAIKQIKKNILIDQNSRRLKRYYYFLFKAYNKLGNHQKVIECVNWIKSSKYFEQDIWTRVVYIESLIELKKYNKAHEEAASAKRLLRKDHFDLKPPEKESYKKTLNELFDKIVIFKKLLAFEEFMKENDQVSALSCLMFCADKKPIDPIIIKEMFRLSLYLKELDQFSKNMLKEYWAFIKDSPKDIKEFLPSLIKVDEVIIKSEPDLYKLFVAYEKVQSDQAKALAEKQAKLEKEKKLALEKKKKADQARKKAIAVKNTNKGDKGTDENYNRLGQEPAEVMYVLDGFIIAALLGSIVSFFQFKYNLMPVLKNIFNFTFILTVVQFLAAGYEKVLFNQYSWLAKGIIFILFIVIYLIAINQSKGITRTDIKTPQINSKPGDSYRDVLREIEQSRIIEHETGDNQQYKITVKKRPGESDEAYNKKIFEVLTEQYKKMGGTADSIESTGDIKDIIKKVLAQSINEMGLINIQQFAGESKDEYHLRIRRFLEKTYKEKLGITIAANEVDPRQVPGKETISFMLPSEGTSTQIEEIQVVIESTDDPATLDLRLPPSGVFGDEQVEESSMPDLIVETLPENQKEN